MNRQPLYTPIVNPFKLYSIMEQNTYRIPAHFVVALINDDYSALSDQDEIELNTWLKNVNPGHATCPDGEPFFSHNNDINNLGSDCYDVVFIS